MSSNEDKSYKIGPYTVTRELGQGYTAWVYLAENETGRQVALKTLKDGLPEDMQERFFAEGMLIEELHGYEANSAFALDEVFRNATRFDPQLAEQFKSLPLPTSSLIVGLVEQNKGHQPPYLALEFLQGQTALARLQQSSEGVLPEPEIVNIGWQFAYVLHLLHEGCQRSYDDMKLDNIWLVNDQQIKVNDWNIVSPYKRPKIGQDLLKFGKFLFQMATGIVLEFSDERGVPVEGLAKLGGERWQDLTLGMQALISQAVHPNESKRFPTAQTLGQGLWDLHLAWQQPADNVLMAVEKLLKGIAEAPEQGKLAQSWLAVLERRYHEVSVPELIADFKSELQSQIPDTARGLQQAVTLWQGGSYPTAQEVVTGLLKAKEFSLGLYRLQAILSYTMQHRGALPAREKEALERLWASLDEGDWVRAGEAKQSLSDPLFADIGHEIVLRQKMAEATEAEQAGEWQAARQAYDRATEALHSITEKGYVEALLFELPHPKTLADQASNNHTTFGQAKKALERAKQAQNETQVREALLEGYMAAPTYFPLQQQAYEWMEAAAKQGQLEPAMAYGHILQNCYDTHPEGYALYRQVNQWWSVATALTKGEIPGRYQSVVADIPEAYQVVGNHLERLKLRAEQSFKELRINLERLQRQAQDSQAQIAQLEKQIAELQSTNQANKANKRQLEADLQAARSQLEQLRPQLEQANKDVEQFRQQLIALVDGPTTGLSLEQLRQHAGTNINNLTQKQARQFKEQIRTKIQQFEYEFRLPADNHESRRLTETAPVDDYLQALETTLDEVKTNASGGSNNSKIVPDDERQAIEQTIQEAKKSKKLSQKIYTRLKARQRYLIKIKNSSPNRGHWPQSEEQLLRQVKKQLQKEVGMLDELKATLTPFMLPVATLLGIILGGVIGVGVGVVASPVLWPYDPSPPVVSWQPAVSLDVPLTSGSISIPLIWRGEMDALTQLTVTLTLTQDGYTGTYEGPLIPDSPEAQQAGFQNQAVEETVPITYPLYSVTGSPREDEARLTACQAQNECHSVSVTLVSPPLAIESADESAETVSIPSTPTPIPPTATPPAPHAFGNLELVNITYNKATKDDLIFETRWRKRDSTPLTPDDFNGLTVYLYDQNSTEFSNQLTLLSPEITAGESVLVRIDRPVAGGTYRLEAADQIVLRDDIQLLPLTLYKFDVEDGTVLTLNKLTLPSEVALNATTLSQSITLTSTWSAGPAFDVNETYQLAFELLLTDTMVWSSPVSLITETTQPNVVTHSLVVSAPQLGLVVPTELRWWVRLVDFKDQTEPKLSIGADYSPDGSFSYRPPPLVTWEPPDNVIATLTSDSLSVPLTWRKVWSPTEPLTTSDGLIVTLTLMQEGTQTGNYGGPLFQNEAELAAFQDQAESLEIQYSIPVADLSLSEGQAATLTVCHPQGQCGNVSVTIQRGALHTFTFGGSEYRLLSITPPTADLSQESITFTLQWADDLKPNQALRVAIVDSNDNRYKFGTITPATAEDGVVEVDMFYDPAQSDGIDSNAFINAIGTTTHSLRIWNGDQAYQHPITVTGVPLQPPQ